jgi:hypothetical protein
VTRGPPFGGVIPPTVPFLDGAARTRALRKLMSGYFDSIWSGIPSLKACARVQDRTRSQFPLSTPNLLTAPSEALIENKPRQ